MPKSVRDAHAWGPGTEFLVEETPKGILLRPQMKSAPTDLAQVAGSLKYTGTAKTLDEMEQAISEEIEDRHARGRY